METCCIAERISTKEVVEFVDWSLAQAKKPLSTKLVNRSHFHVAPIQEGRVRLVSGSNAREGRVEIYHNGRWGTICDDFWDISDAHVVCRELNYTKASEAKSYAHFGAGPDPIWLDDVEYTGSEKRLADCKHNGWGSHNCVHHEDAGVVCTSHPPVYGGWSAWIDHGCCDSGTRRKSRTCTNPSPKHGGRQCTGSRYLTASCNMGCCPVNGGWSQWVSDACNVTCGGGMLTMTREQTALVYQNMRNNAITNVVQWMVVGVIGL